METTTTTGAGAFDHAAAIEAFCDPYQRSCHAVQVLDQLGITEPAEGEGKSNADWAALAGILRDEALQAQYRRYGTPTPIGTVLFERVMVCRRKAIARVISCYVDDEFGDAGWLAISHKDVYDQLSKSKGGGSSYSVFERIAETDGKRLGEIFAVLREKRVHDWRLFQLLAAALENEPTT